MPDGGEGLVVCEERHGLADRGVVGLDVGAAESVIAGGDGEGNELEFGVPGGREEGKRGAAGGGTGGERGEGRDGEGGGGGGEGVEDGAEGGGGGGEHDDGRSIMGVVFGDCLVMVECWIGNLVGSAGSGGDDVAGVVDGMKYLSMRNRHASYRQTHIITTPRTLPIHSITTPYYSTRLCYFQHFSLAYFQASTHHPSRFMIFFLAKQLKQLKGETCKAVQTYTGWILSIAAASEAEMKLSGGMRGIMSIVAEVGRW